MGVRGGQGIPRFLLGLSKIPRSKSFTTHDSLSNIREVGRGTKEDQDVPRATSTNPYFSFSYFLNLGGEEI